jgi:hypothetical protein
MNDVAFDTVTRYASADEPRRTALMAFGTAGLLALASSFTVEAKSSSKKKAKKKCKAQVAQCTTFFESFCVTSGDPDCSAKAAACCPTAGNGDAVGFLLCFSGA